MKHLSTTLFLKKQIKSRLLHLSSRQMYTVFDRIYLEETPSKSALVKYKGQVELTLVERKLMTHDTYLFRFGLPEKDLVMGTNVSNHIRLNLVAPTKEFPTGILIRRKYTPTSDVNLEGYVDLPIKIYRPGVHPKFPNGGEFTPILEKLKIGDKVLADGPYKRIEYFGDGYFKIGAKIHK